MLQPISPRTTVRVVFFCGTSLGPAVCPCRHSTLQRGPAAGRRTRLRDGQFLCGRRAGQTILDLARQVEIRQEGEVDRAQTLDLRLPTRRQDLTDLGSEPGLRDHMQAGGTAFRYVNVLSNGLESIRSVHGVQADTRWLIK